MRLVRSVTLALACIAALAALLLSRRDFQPAATPHPIGDSSRRVVPPRILAAGTRGAAFVASVGATRAPDAARARARAFNDWLLAWRRADAATQPALVAEGRRLAGGRRDALAYLIQADPKLALSLAVPPGVRHELPADLRDLLEEQVDTRGRLDVSVRCFDATPGHVDEIERVATAGDRHWHAHVFGRRESQTSQANLPLHGIALGTELALSEQPYRVIESAEDGCAPAAGEFAVRVGGEIVRLRHPAALDALRGQLVAAESATDPATPPVAALPVGWATGAKRVLFMRADFSDAAGSTMTDADINAGVAAASAFYQDITQNQFSLTATILPGVFHLSNTQAYYRDTPFALNDMGDDLVKRAHDYDVANGGTGRYDADRADRWVIVFPHLPETGFAGVGQIGERGIWMNGAFDGAVLAHELGHNNGVYHSHAWQVASGAPFATTGTHVEYGDIYDIMGTSRVLSAAAFNAPQKVILGYLPAEAVTSVTQNGTYRLFRHDHVSASGVRALKVSSTLYDTWLEYRRAAPADFTAAQVAALQNSVQVHATGRPWFTSGYGPYLLDMNPDAQGDMTDAGLGLNRTYTDAEAGVSVTPTAVGGTTPNEYIDVKVELGGINGNHNPVLASTAPGTTFVARTDVNFSATATDPDNDAVQYRWDFGDRRENPATASVAHRWLKGGAYTVSAIALDGKGGRSLVSYPVTITDPLLQWTARAQEITTSQVYLAGIYAGGRFVFAGSNGAMMASNDGISWNALTSPAPTLTVTGLAHNGARFVAIGRHAAGDPALWSSDGLTWQTAPMPAGTPNLNAVAASSSRFVAVGPGGKIYQSADGQSWAAAVSGITDDLLDVAYANNLFVAVGYSGRVVTSTDGLTWANHSISKPHILQVVTRAGNLWYATPGTYVWTSPDAVTWTEQSETPNTNVQRMTSMADGTALAVTAEGTIAWTQGTLPWDSTVIDPQRPTELHEAIAVGNGLVVIAGFDGRVYTAGTPTVAAPLLRDLHVIPQVQAGRANPVAVSGSNFTKLELLVNGQVVDQNNGAAALAWTPSRFGTYQVAARGTFAGGTTATSNTETVTAAYSDWSWSNPLPFIASLTGGVRVNDRWYLSGAAGGVFTVDDAGNATRANIQTNEKFTDLEYANGRFVVTSEAFDRARETSGYGLWASNDGVTWIPYKPSAGVSLGGVVYGPGLWVAVGQEIRTSTDGVDWTRIALPASLLTSLTDVAYGAGQWIAVGQQGVILASTDGATWTVRTSGSTQFLTGIAYRDGHWVAVGQHSEILHSTDGVAWTRVAVTGVANDDFNRVSRTGSGFVAVGQGGAAIVSTDGLAWSAATKPAGQNSFSGLATDGTNTLLLGSYGAYLAPAAATDTWTRPPTFRTTAEAKQVIYANGRFVAVGDSTDLDTGAAASPINVSSDGFTWTPAVAAGSETLPLYSVTWNGSRFVAVGGDGIVYTSTDGLAWTRATPHIGEMRSIASSANMFVAVGFDALASSPDGVTWTSRSNGTSAAHVFLNSVTYGSAGFVAVGDNGIIITSPDGVTWTQRTSGTTNRLSVAAVTQSLGYTVGGLGSSILISTDGVTWTSRNIGLVSNETVTGISDTPQGIVIASNTGGRLTYSGDGTTWFHGSVPSSRALYGFAVGPTTIVGVGERGLFLAQSRGQRVIATSPTARDTTAGGTTSFSAGSVAVSDATYQWQRNGTDLVSAISPTLTLGNLQPANTGIYYAVATSASQTATTAPAILGLTTASKVIGNGSEIAANIAHPNGNVFDQVLLNGTAATFTADATLHQVTRLSFVDLTDDIVQVEFSGAGSVSIVLDAASGPAAPVNYNQPTVSYMKGHAGLVITGADETTNVSVFSVGRATAFDPTGAYNILLAPSATNVPANNGSSLFVGHATTNYDGIADIAFIAITSSNGKFGGLRTSNTNYFATKGITGLYAPGVQFTGPLFIGDINAQDNATPYLVIGAGDDVRVTGGDMLQANGRAVVVAGLTQLKFTAGGTSGGGSLPAQNNRGRFEQNGTDVTSQIVVNP